MSHASLFVGNDTLLRVGTTSEPLTNRESGAVISGASVSAVVKTSTGGLVAGATSVSLSETTNSGVYTGTVPDTASVVEDGSYEVEVTADGGAGLKGFWVLSARGRERYR